MSLFCRHNRFTAECPICSKGTVLDPNRSARPRPKAAQRKAAGRPVRSAARGAASRAARVTVGPHALAGPYEADDGLRHVRLERVPGGLRLASWIRGSLVRAAPVLPLLDLPDLVRQAVEREVVSGRDADALRAAVSPGAPAGDGAPGAAVGEFGASPGRSGELREELRVERLPDDEVRVARWLYRPGTRVWELQDAPPMLPAARFAEAIAAAVRRGVVPLG